MSNKARAKRFMAAERLMALTTFELKKELDDWRGDIYISQHVKVGRKLIMRELHRRDVEAFRSQTDAPAESEWSDEDRMMFSLMFPMVSG
jgi:hypothetical protein